MFYMCEESLRQMFSLCNYSSKDIDKSDNGTWGLSHCRGKKNIKINKALHSCTLALLLDSLQSNRHLKITQRCQPRRRTLWWRPGVFYVKKGPWLLPVFLPVSGKCLSSKRRASTLLCFAPHVLIKPLGEAEVASPTLDGSGAPVWEVPCHRWDVSRASMCVPSLLRLRDACRNRPHLGGLAAPDMLCICVCLCAREC